MALARVAAFAIDGVESRLVTVEADIRSGLPAFTIIGLADKAVREARDRVRSSLTNSGYAFPDKRITVNLAPAYLRKAGASFDLAIAVAILVASGQLPQEAGEGCAFAGELSLYGELRPVWGTLALAQGTAAHGLRRLFVPRRCGREAALVEAIEPVAVETLQEAAAVLLGSSAPPLPEPTPAELASPPPGPDLSEVRGHNGLIPAIEVAAAGGHNLFLHGPPGTGKTMLARRLGSILPPLTRDEGMEVTRIYSVAGRDCGGGLIFERPYRAPHHGISASGLVGGGPTPMPGEITLAHHGVLFLDELSEFNRAALEALRQPLEDGRVVVVRGQRVLAFPTRAMVVAATNPCPCGHGGQRCRCSGADLARHERRLSGPLLDRFDITIHVPRPGAVAFREQTAPSSAEVRERVIAARERQLHRLQGLGVACNAQMTPSMLRDLAGTTTAAHRELHALHDRNRLTARGHDRVLRVARTIADLEGSDVLTAEHVLAASSYRGSGEPELLAA